MRYSLLVPELRVQTGRGLRPVPPHVPRKGELAVRALRKARRSLGPALGVPSLVRATLLRHAARRTLADVSPPRRLCLGSGRAPIPGWVNIDIEPPADVLLDLRYGIPAPAASIQLIYSEHVVEHLDLEEALALFRECRRVLHPSGVIRIATPDLADIIRDYESNWRRHAWVNWPEYGWIDSGVRMVNQGMRGWGHRYLYDFPELRRRLLEAGFAYVERRGIGESSDPDLAGLETREDSSLVVEAYPLPSTVRR